MSQEQHPLQNPANWNKPKTWVVPLAVTVYVDDPELYDGELEDFIKKLLNELRASVTTFDKTGKQLRVKPLSYVKDPDQIKALEKGSASGSNVSQDDLDAKIAKAMEKYLGNKGKSE